MAEVWRRRIIDFHSWAVNGGKIRKELKTEGDFTARQWAEQEIQGGREGGKRVKRMKEIESDKKRQRGYEALQQPLRKAHWGKVWLTGRFTGKQRILPPCQSRQTVAPMQSASPLSQIFPNQDLCQGCNKSSESSNKAPCSTWKRVKILIMLSL